MKESAECVSAKSNSPEEEESSEKAVGVGNGTLERDVVVLSRRCAMFMIYWWQCQIYCYTILCVCVEVVLGSMFHRFQHYYGRLIDIGKALKFMYVEFTAIGIHDI